MVSAEPLLQPQGIVDETPETPIHSLTHLLDHRAEYRSNEPAIFTMEPGSDELKVMTYAHVKRATERLAWHYHHLRLPDNASTAPPAPGETNSTIGIFYRSSLNLTFTEFAMQRLGQAALLISPNNPATAVAGLLKATDTHVLLAGEKLYDIALETVTLLRGEAYSIELYHEKVFPLFGSEGTMAVKIPSYPLRLEYQQETLRTCITLHSSGSTGFPKPLPGTHKSVLANGAANFGFAAATVLPLFHGFGHHASLRCIAAAQPLFVYPPHLPTTASNITHFLQACRAASPVPIRQLFAVAYILKLLSESEEATRCISEFDVVAFAGSALPDEVGDRLTAAGVKLISQYGTTETGTVMTSSRHFREDKGWNWLRVTGPAKPFVVMEERGSGVYECVVKNGFGSLAITNRPDGFASKDLFLRHPENADQWKYCGRADDTLTQTLGEKTNPVPMELAIRGFSEFIAEAIVFGDGRPQCGCLILPSELCGKMSSEAIRELVQPAVEFANKTAPTHSQIAPELVEILPVGTEVPLATKGSILRPACYAVFKNLIDSIYEKYSSSGPAEKLALEEPELHVHILAIISRTVDEDKAKLITVDTDLFNFGIDSLQSSRIRLLLVRSIDTAGCELSQNVVYEYPSVAKLARHLYQLRSGAEVQTDAQLAQQAHAVMWNLVRKYTESLQHHQPGSTATSSSKHVVVLTGATGALGSHILAKLVISPDVYKVYALVRAADDTNAAARIHSSLRQRKVSGLTDDHMEKIHALSSDLDKADLGLSPHKFAEIQASVTAVIANAWSVNFNLSVESFEAGNIRAVHNLLNLCLASPYDRPASFYFSSSVSTRQGKWTETAEEEITNDPAYAVATGYGRSKWISEKICQIASQTRGVHCGVFRIGQMGGDTVHGVWNTTEAIPLMFRTAQVVKALPILDDHPSYLPVDISAAGITEIVLAGDRGPTSALYHIVNPNNSTSFDEIYDYFEQAGYTGFERIDRKEWLKRLEFSSSDPAENPSYKLLQFFRNRFAGPKLNPQIKFEVKETSKVAPSIANCPPITADIVAKWVGAWRDVGFFV